MASLLPVTGLVGAPVGFPASGNGLWYAQPAVNWSTQYLPIGNGYLGGTPTPDWFHAD